MTIGESSRRKVGIAGLIMGHEAALFVGKGNVGFTVESRSSMVKHEVSLSQKCSST